MDNLEKSTLIRHHQTQGFTLIELMVVMLIIGLLASICVPTYQGYLTKAKVTEGLQMASEQQAIIEQYLSLNGSLDNLNLTQLNQQSKSNYGKYVSSISLAPPANIIITFNGQSGILADTGFILKPILSANKSRIISWTCTAQNKKNYKQINQLLPRSCKK